MSLHCDKNYSSIYLLFCRLIVSFSAFLRNKIKAWQCLSLYSFAFYMDLILLSKKLFLSLSFSFFQSFGIRQAHVFFHPFLSFERGRYEERNTHNSDIQNFNHLSRQYAHVIIVTDGFCMHRFLLFSFGCLAAAFSLSDYITRYVLPHI